MKKVFMTLVAAATLLFAACSGSSTNNGGSAESGSKAETKAAAEPIIPVDPAAKLDKTYEGDNFSLQFPSSLSPNAELSKGESCFIADENEDVVLRGDYFDWAMQVTMKEYAEQIHHDGVTYEAPIVKEKQGFVLKGKSDRNTVYHYMVLKGDKGGVSGSIEFTNDKAAEYDKYVGAIVNSIKFK